MSEQLRAQAPAGLKPRRRLLDPVCRCPRWVDCRVARPNLWWTCAPRPGQPLAHQNANRRWAR